MAQSMCSVDGCERPTVARGWCDMHYRRWWKTGICDIPDCDKPVKAHGWCGMHYQRWRKHGDVNYVAPPVDPRRCLVPGCDRKHCGHGYCQAHMERAAKGLDLSAPFRLQRRPTDDPVEWFWAAVDSSGGPDACWPWRRGKSRGYGDSGPIACASDKAHVNAHWLANGPVPEGLLVRHLCHNPPCCNPAHLAVGTDADNAADMVAAGRSPRGERNPQSKLTTDQVLAIRARCAAGESRAAIARELGVTPSNIEYIVLRRSWKHV